MVSSSRLKSSPSVYLVLSSSELLWTLPHNLPLWTYNIGEGLSVLLLVVSPNTVFPFFTLCLFQQFLCPVELQVNREALTTDQVLSIL